MVAPVTGPLAKPVVETRMSRPNGTTVKVLVKTRTGYRQKKPYNLPLPATMVECRARSGDYDSRNPGYPIGINSSSYNLPWRQTTSPGSSLVSEAYNQAYERLRAGLLGDAAFGINYVQRKEAIGMMSDRVLQLYSFTRHIRRFEFNRAADDLGLSRKRVSSFNLKKEVKALGNNWLEFHFGWSPLVHDIYKAIDLSQQPIPDTYLLGSGKANRKVATVTTPYPWQTVRKLNSMEVKVRLGVHCKVDNPNLWLANKMGLVNPAIVLWDAVPFSFVVDWFLNVGSVLGSYTDFAGLATANPWKSTFSRSVYTEDQTVMQQNNRTVLDYKSKDGSTVVEFNRVLGIGGGPTLKVKKPWQVSATRGATAISLLLQAMR